MVQVSPPSGATTVAPARGAGLGTTAYFRFAVFASTGNCQGPLTIMAALPAWNCSRTSAWVQFSTDFDAEPDLTRSTHSCSAWATSGEARFFSSPPLLHMNGRNCQVPS